jgi:hypothetical protein
VNPPSDTLLRHFNMFYLAPWPSSLQFTHKIFVFVKIGLIWLKCNMSFSRINFNVWNSIRTYSLFSTTFFLQLPIFVRPFPLLWGYNDVYKGSPNGKCNVFSGGMGRWDAVVDRKFDPSPLKVAQAWPSPATPLFILSPFNKQILLYTFLRGLSRKWTLN